MRYHFASEYRDRGWSVIPLHGKRPALESWKEYQLRRPTRDEVRYWFGANSKANIGIVTGALSELIVVDCDTREDTAHWTKSFPLSPLSVQTGSGGLHVYYRAPKGATVNNHVRINERRIDIRGDGGYVVAPPSEHPNGKPYSWHVFGDYSLEEIPIFDPDWIAPRRRTEPSNLCAGVRNIKAPSAYIRKSLLFPVKAEATPLFEPHVSYATLASRL